jgi:tetratricopeptide (TPR) repeat protein
MDFVAGVLLVGLVASAGPGQFAAIYQAGLAKQRAGQYAEARRDFEEALARAIRVVDKADARLGIAATHDAQRNYRLARAEFSKVLLIEGATPDQKARAQLGIASAYLGERNYELARTESEKVLAMPESPAPRIAEAQLLSGVSLANRW